MPFCPEYGCRLAIGQDVKGNVTYLVAERQESKE